MSVKHKDPTFDFIRPDRSFRFTSWGPVGGITPLAVSASSLTPTEGDNVTLTASGGSGSRQWYRDGRYVLGGTSSILSLSNIGVQDAGDYTCVRGSDTSDTLTVTVTANNIVTDNFTSGVSGDWTSTTGTPNVTGGKLVVDGGTGVTLNKTISNDICRFKFKLNATSLTAGNFTCFNLQGSDNHAIVSGLIIGGGSPSLRFTPNVDGWTQGGNGPDFYPAGYVAAGYRQYNGLSGETEIEVFWDYTNRSAFVYVGGDLFFSVVDVIDHPGFAIRAAVTFTIGNIDGSGGTGTITFDAVEVKQGAVAANAFTAKAKQAVVWIGGQSNAAGAMAGSYSAVTDDIGTYTSHETATNAPSGATHGTLSQDYAPSSTRIDFSFIQSIDLPAGYTPHIVTAGFGSTGFSTNPGWGTVNNLYRERAKNGLTISLGGVEQATPIALLWHQGEADAGSDVYQADLTLLISEVRAITGTVGGLAVPWISGGLSPAFLTGGENFQADSQETTDDLEGLESSVTRYKFASSVLPSALGYQAGNPDWIHFSAAGYRAFGPRYASEYLSLVPEATP